MSTQSHTLTLSPVPALCTPEQRQKLQKQLDHKTKPLGALGRLEALALQIGCILQTDRPELICPQLLVCAADHGLAAQGVSAYPKEVTWQMVANFLAGGAAVSVLARQHGLQLTVVDCGVDHEWQNPPGHLWLRKVEGAARGTADASQGPALTQAQCAQAVTNGQELLQQLPGNVVLLGEMGIANTSSAALLMAKFTGLDVQQCVGRGTGLDDPGLAHKLKVLQQVLNRHAGVGQSLPMLAAVGGLEIATLVGVVLQAAAQRRVVLVDGFITSVAVLVAHALQPQVLDYCVFSHVSHERGHPVLLQHLQVQALLQLDLRLGEGSGAALAWPLLVSACRILCEMASFDSAGVSAAHDQSHDATP
jgi:nicotinate-nucleotide--dimethylbenzimidazole phosphoribosyltransferase